MRHCINKAIQAKLQELVLSDTQLEEINEIMEEEASCTWCAETLVKIIEKTAEIIKASPGTKEPTRLFKFMWILHCFFLMGHRAGLKLMREGIKQEIRLMKAGSSNLKKHSTRRRARR